MCVCSGGGGGGGGVCNSKNIVHATFLVISNIWSCVRNAVKLTALYTTKFWKSI